MDLQYEISSPDVVAEDFGTEIVVLNLVNGKYFSFTEFAAALWNDLSTGFRPVDLLARLPSQEALQERTTQFIQDLVREGLLRPASDQPVSVPPDTNPRVASCASLDPPRLVAFDDMAELILADPIHDVEEDIGWPVKRTPGV
jgi:hypothetical protein